MAFTDYLSGAGTLASSAFDIWGQAEANRQNRNQAKDNRNFQERMSNTSWQRGMADMRAAGINPMLAINSGGASSPSGSTANMQSTTSGTANSALSSRRLAADLDNLRATNLKIQSDVRLNDALTNSAKASTATTLAKLPEQETWSNFWQAGRDLSSSVVNSARSLFDQAIKPETWDVDRASNFYRRAKNVSRKKFN